MKKRLLQSFSLLAMILVVFSCCKKSASDIYFNANDIRLKNTYQLIEIRDGVTVNQDGYRIKCYLNDKTVKYISDINDLNKSFGYCENNFIGLAKDISNLKISCDKDVWNISAGTPLNQNNIRVFGNKSAVDAENERLTIVEWLSYINNEDQLVTFEWFIEFVEIIDSSEYLKFTLTFELEDGSEYVTETGPVKFE